MSASVAIDGPLTFATLRQHLKVLDGADGATLDLAACPRIDSAGAAYLLERARRARRAGGTLQVVNANEQIRNLLAFFELDQVIGIA